MATTSIKVFGAQLYKETIKSSSCYIELKNSGLNTEFCRNAIAVE